MTPIIVGWSSDERHILLSFKGLQEWFPVVRLSGLEVVCVGESKYVIGATKLTPH